MTVQIDIRHAFNGFDLAARFDAPKGVTALFGASGSGKTTIINAVAGLLTPQNGRIVVDGRVLFDSKTGVNTAPNKRKIGYIFQDARLFPHMTVRQNLTYGRPAGPIDAVVDMLGLDGLLGRRPAKLSGGEAQRVAIGRALLSNPDLILADEPLAALDEARKSEILPYFEKLRDHANVPILYVSHSANEVARLATTVVVLNKGRVTHAGSAETVLSDPTVTPTGVRSAGAVMQARVLRHDDDGLTVLSIGASNLIVPNCDAPVGTDLRLRIAAQDVMIATAPLSGISALNTLPATITAIRKGDGPGALVQMETGGASFLARITRRSLTALDLNVGQTVHAVIKAVSIDR